MVPGSAYIIQRKTQVVNINKCILLLNFFLCERDSRQKYVNVVYLINDLQNKLSLLNLVATFIATFNCHKHVLFNSATLKLVFLLFEITIMKFNYLLVDL